jgi:ATP-dependent Clp protease ATP-binding subunit ClpA
MTRTQTFGYTAGFRRLLDYASHDCALRGEHAVRVDHLVMGLYREDFPLIDEILGSFRVDSLVVLDRLLKANPATGDARRVSDVELAPEAMGAIAVGEREAAEAGDRQLAPAHVFLGILEYRRDRLADFFIRDEHVKRGEQVLARVRELVRWLRLGDQTASERDIEILEDGTWVTMDSQMLRGGRDGKDRKSWAVKLRMLGPLSSR